MYMYFPCAWLERVFRKRRLNKAPQKSKSHGIALLERHNRGFASRLSISYSHRDIHVTITVGL